MKTFIVLSFGLLISLQSIGQENSDRALYQAKVKKYKGMKDGGILITIVGTALVVAGVITSIPAAHPLTSQQSDDFKSGENIRFAGVVCLGTGIPLTAIGLKNERKYKRKLNTLSARLNAHPQSKGLTLIYRF